MKKSTLRIISKIGFLLVLIGFLMPISCNQTGFETAEMAASFDGHNVFSISFYAIFSLACIGIILLLFLVLKKNFSQAIDWAVVGVTIIAASVILGNASLFFLKFGPQVFTALQGGAFIMFFGLITAIGYQIMYSLEDTRPLRQEVYEKLFSAKALCITGVLIMPALFFNPIPYFRIFQFLFFWFLAWLFGRKNNPLFTTIVIVSIVVFNLFVPHGQILFTLGGFRVTSGALTVGLNRAATLIGLMMLSRVAIRPDLKIPGLFGELIGESFRIFSLLMNQKERITGDKTAKKNIISNLDKLMIELNAESASTTATPVAASRTKPAGFVILAIIVFISWSPWILMPNLPLPLPAGMLQGIYMFLFVPAVFLTMAILCIVIAVNSCLRNKRNLVNNNLTPAATDKIDTQASL